ncbi:lamin tail domain-containing protein [Nostoc sp. FACHB-110]|nr:lamin tail domain-containing protein [Nostoc sp. FACHB-110]
MQPVQAEGSRNLYPSGATGFRANLEWRAITSSRYGPTTPVDNSLARRTLLQVYAKAGEYILLGSSSVGSNNGDIFLYGNKTGRIGNETLSNLKFQCSTQRSQTGNTNQGKISSRNQELAGPDTITNTTNATPGNQVTYNGTSGYVPCYYQVPAGSDGIYYVVITGSDGFNGTTDGNPTENIDLGSNFVDKTGTSVAAWDVTVRSSLTSTTDINGRLFADYLALFTGGNGRLVESVFYLVTKDGYRYRTALNGLDPNGFVIYGNDIGYYDSDGKTPLYHDVLGNSGTLTTLQGGTNLALPNHVIFFSDPQTNSGANDAIAARGIPLVAVLPVVSNSSFAGTAGSNNSNQNTGGVFKFDTNVSGNYEIIISKDGKDFDPSNVNNRVLRGIMATTGSQTVTWDGKDNSGNFFPVGTDYPVKITTHAGEYHFPLIDAENSINGGPSFTLLNVTNPLGQKTGFYDDRGYRTLSGVNVGTVNSVLCGLNPPSTPNSNLVTGFDTTSTQRAFGANPGSNTNGSCTGSFGDAKGLDIWTYVPSTATLTYLNIIPATSPQVSPLAGKVIINEVLYSETGTTADTNDEFIEIYNTSTSAVDLSGVRLTDSNLIVGSSDGAGGFSYTFPSGTTLQSGQYAVIWLGNNQPKQQATAAAFQTWLGLTPKLNNSGDDVWLYDNQNQIIDYVAYGAGSEVNTPPPTSLNIWNNTYQSSLAGTSNGQSISLTPNGQDSNSSACWEATTSGNASTRCTNYLPTRDTDTVGSRITSVGESNNGAATNAKLLLIKRITRINSQDLTDIVDGRSDVATNAANYVPEPYATDDSDSKWPVSYLRGLINAGTVKPGDEVEYTIYFLSKGPNNATNVKFCDLVPSNTTFLPTAFNGLTPRDGGLPGADSGIALAVGSSTPTVYLSNIADSDRGTFYAANDSATPSYCGNNTNGAVVVNVTRSPDLPNLPAATNSGTPASSYGFIRFRAKVK